MEPINGRLPLIRESGERKGYYFVEAYSRSLDSQYLHRDGTFRDELDRKLCYFESKAEIEALWNRLSRTPITAEDREWDMEEA
jgi:hypothetical protein